MRSIFYMLLSVFILQQTFAQQAGSLDFGFGNDGKVVTDLSPINNSNHLEKIVVQPDGKILAIGWLHTYIGGDPSSDYSDAGLIRYLPTGELDTTFGENGIVVSNLSSDSQRADFIRAGTLQSDGKIVCVGSVDGTESLEAGVVRLLQNGSVDSSFGMNGVFSIDPSTVQPDEANGVAIQSDGKIVVGISSSSPIGGLVIRLMQDGTIDSTYGNNGMIDLSHEVENITVQNDGKVVAVGSFNLPTDPIGQFAVSRITENGTLDSSFGNSGMYFFEHSDIIGIEYTSVLPYSVVLDGNNRIIIGGSTEILNTGEYDSKFAIGRLNPDGSLDQSFGIGGRNVIDIPGEYERIRDVVLGLNGKIYAIGYAGVTDFAVACLDESGFLDSSFAQNGILLLDFDNNNDYGTAGAMQPDGKLVLGGVSMNSDGRYEFAVARMLTDLNIGIAELTESVSNTLIYPNPIKEQARLQFELTQSEELNISLFDMQGRLVQTFISEQEMIQGKHDLQLQFSSSLESGTYLLSVSSEKGQMGIRVIKR
ncbi:MAG: T9SS type A sorting domain-containing protein [Flavobacteriales bacterium]|nr:T9SS type A sorting domain-containing protein [Flavobacteriales bacterium]